MALPFGAIGNSSNFSFPRSWAADYAVNLPVQAATSTLGLSFRNILNTFSLDLAISAAEQRGRARIISAPRIMVQNNEEAEIESGVQIPIVNTTATEIEVTFVSASLRLKVQPQITADDTIIMDVDLENNQPIFIQTVGDNASIATRRASTVVAVPDGQWCEWMGRRGEQHEERGREPAPDPAHVFVSLGHGQMIADGGTEFIELGPGKVLQGLMRKIDRSVSASGMN